ncbi:uncharacterized protein LACBIDRAFT_328333 [Laccaria bicolor S238N-H82]|uniref:Predicted protein n=1 Tax=Laccaria bicolor (strain S238N-H82 / ATCC MYA-4686) TaxID=486041 RepID=B0DEK2_LACBS|nr:uncharacterized protein LACBIDRAFT_328333 [Laccaria bicolor S238N-H82]EDR07048.1 predicted protein [Laccaria bicolor S238N-H82]|eukprot:XP_001882421.1 predicted protein [Laccaria bicolor S238N-H82]
MESLELEDSSDEQESNGAESGLEEQTSEFEEGCEGNMTHNAKLADKHDVEIEGVLRESGETAVTDMATNVTIDDVGSEKDSHPVLGPPSETTPSACNVSDTWWWTHIRMGLLNVRGLAVKHNGITYVAFRWKLFHETGFARLVGFALSIMFASGESGTNSISLNVCGSSPSSKFNAVDGLVAGVQATNVVEIHAMGMVEARTTSRMTATSTRPDYTAHLHVLRVWDGFSITGFVGSIKVLPCFHAMDFTPLLHSLPDVVASLVVIPDLLTIAIPACQASQDVCRKLDFIDNFAGHTCARGCYER